MKERIRESILAFRGKKPITDGMRFRILAVSLGIVHLIQASAMAVMDCLPLAITGFFAFLLDLLSIFITRKCRNYFGWITVVYFATCSYSLFACVMLGWTYGFSLYNLAMIPVMFYMLYLTEHVKHPKKSALIYTLVNCAATLLLRRIVYGGKPVCYYPVNTDFKISFFNNIVCFLILIVFSTLFILELTFWREELETQNKKLVRLANYDSLTQLRNRRSLLDEWKKLERADYCVIMGDIDDFKKINDTYGHEQGDEVLKLVSSVMSAAVDEEAYVSRWGGEEFLLLIFGTVDNARKAAERIQKGLKEADMRVLGQKVPVTMTFGISACGESLEGKIDELIQRADSRLYLGKRNGKNCIVTRE